MLHLLLTLGLLAHAPPQDATPSWPELLERDRTLGFTPLTRDKALSDLALGELTPQRRASALMALGCARAGGERSRLESWAQEGSAIERQAAILGLGEMTLADARPLVQLAEDPEPEIARCALLALVRGGSAAGVHHVQRLAAAEGELSEAAADALVFALDPAQSRETPEARSLLELRFEAAKRYGLIEGQAWPVLVCERLCADEDFLDRVIYIAAATLRDGAVRDHFLELVLRGPPPEALRGAVVAMPTELSRLVASGLWQPADDAAWRALLEEIDASRLEGLADPILEQASAIPELRAWALLLRVRGGAREELEQLTLERSATGAGDRARIAEALGESADPDLTTSLAPMLEDPDPLVRAAALVALARLGEPKSVARLEGRMADAEDPERDHLVEALRRAARSAHVSSLLATLFPELEGDARLGAAIALARSGHAGAREEVRAALRERPPAGAQGEALVRALIAAPDAGDLALLRELFPVEGEPAISARIARALIELRDPLVLPVLRAALWRGPWNRSVLAGGLMAKVAGIGSLLFELQRPPETATSRDLRRVGFALGEWGGLDQLEILDERRIATPAVEGALLGALGARTR
jgi:HEAT repeat protein